MKAAHRIDHSHSQSGGHRQQDLKEPEHVKEELIMNLERDQLVAETSRPIPQAPLGPYTAAGLWALRVFVVVVSLMVIYTFVHQLP